MRDEHLICYGILNIYNPVSQPHFQLIGWKLESDKFENVT